MTAADKHAEARRASIALTPMEATFLYLYIRDSGDGGPAWKEGTMFRRVLERVLRLCKRAGYDPDLVDEITDLYHNTPT